MKRIVINQVLLATLIVILASSCATTNSIDRTGKDVFLDSSNYRQLNGVYSNINMTDGFSVYDVFHKYKTIHKKINNDRVVVSVNVVSQKKNEMRFMQENICVKKMRLRGQFENGYFSANPRCSILNPLFPVLWGPAYYKREIGISSNNNLVILDSRGALVFFLAIPFWVDGNENANEYYRFEN